MSTESGIESKGPPADVHEPVSGRLPIHPPIDPPPPAPTTFDFSVSSLTVKNPRALFEDSDYATLAINVLAADNTVLQQYGPVTQSLGGLGKGLSVKPTMSITGITVPDGASMVASFLVVNKGGWDWDSKAIDALELAGSAVLGAVVQGSIVASSVASAGSTATAVPLPVALAVAAAVIAALEAVNVLFADCDGTVVSGPMTLGKTELLQFASPGPWNFTYDYPGTDSADGCGANSDYSVTYSAEATPAPVVVSRVAVPNIVGMSAASGVIALRQVGLIGIEKVIAADVTSPSNIVGQTPAAGTMVAVNSEVQYEIKARPVVTKPGTSPKT